MPGRLSNPLVQPTPLSPIHMLKHPHLYMPEGNVVIQVQNILFKLDLSVLHDKSPVLRSIVPPVYGGKTRFLGFNDEHPFLLREVKAADFERLLWILFPSETRSYQTLTTDEWLSVLELASRYQIDDVHLLAVERLHALPIDPIRKIAIWEEYHLDQRLLLPSYVALCQRSEPLTLGMAMTLGLKNFTKLAAARDLYHQRLGCKSCGHSSTQGRRSLAQEIVASIFSPLTPTLKQKKPQV